MGQILYRSEKLGSITGDSIGVDVVDFTDVNVKGFIGGGLFLYFSSAISGIFAVHLDIEDINGEGVIDLVLVANYDTVVGGHGFLDKINIMLPEVMPIVSGGIVGSLYTELINGAVPDITWGVQGYIYYSNVPIY